MRRRIADDRHRGVRLARGARPEFQLHLGSDIARPLGQRRIADEEVAILDPDCAVRFDGVQGRGQIRGGRITRPGCQALAYLSRPSLFLAPALRQSARIVTDKVRCELPDVMGEVDVLGEPRNGSIRLGQRRAALEDERRAHGRCEQHLESPDHPDVLFQQIGRPARRTGGDIEHLPTIVAGENQVALSHAPACSQVPLAIPASAR